MSERRAFTRQRTFLPGVLAFQNGAATADCLVRNLTERGAQVELGHPATPETFELRVPTRGLRAEARVAWRNGTRIGLALKPVATEKTASRPALRDEGY